MQKFRMGALAALLALAAGSASARDYHVAVVQSLTGGAAFVGVTATNGAKLAIDEINASNFLGTGNSISASYEDDATDKAQATTIFNRIGRGEPDTLIVYGPTSAATGVVAAQIANELKLPLLANTNSLAVTNTGPYAFRITQTSSDIVPLLVDYAVDKLGLKKCTIITLNDNPAYADLSGAFRDAAARRGLAITETIGIRSSETDFSAMSTRAVGIDADCIYVAAFPEATANVVVQLRAAGLKPGVKLLAPNSAASPQMLKMGGPAVEGMYMFAEFQPGGADAAGHKFVAAYRAKFNADSDNWAPLGYTAMWTIAYALRDAGPNATRESLREAMLRVKDIPVIVGAGKLSIDAQRAPHYGVAMMTVRNGALVQP